MTTDRKLCAMLVLILLVVPACGSSSDQAATPAKDQSDRSSRCMRVSQAKLNAIRSAVTVDGGGKLKNGWAVRSKDYSKVFFIAAEIHGPGMGDNGKVGLWASNELSPGGVTMAVDGFAKEFSDWPDGGKTDAHVGQSDDGAQDAQDCATASAR
jgi:hypothetical protein